MPEYQIRQLVDNKIIMQMSNATDEEIDQEIDLALYMLSDSIVRPPRRLSSFQVVYFTNTLYDEVINAFHFCVSSF